LRRFQSRIRIKCKRINNYESESPVELDQYMYHYFDTSDLCCSNTKSQQLGCCCWMDNRTHMVRLFSCHSLFGWRGVKEHMKPCPKGWVPVCECDALSEDPFSTCFLHGYSRFIRCPYCKRFRRWRAICNFCGCTWGTITYSQWRVEVIPCDGVTAIKGKPGIKMRRGQQ